MYRRPGLLVLIRDESVAAACASVAHRLDFDSHMITTQVSFRLHCV